MPGRKKKKKAKRPPPKGGKKVAKKTTKKKKVVRTPIKVKKEVPRKNNKKVEKALIEFDEGADPTAYPYLRYAAGRHYSTDLNGCSIAQLHKVPLFSIVPVSTLTYWSAEDGWVERRRSFMDELRKKTEEKVGSALVQSRLAQLKNSQLILDDAFSRLTTKAKGKMLEANSLEGMINAYVRLVQVVDDHREKLADAIMPEPIAVQQTANQLPSVRPRLSEGEARAAALTIVRMRRDEIRAAIRSEAQEKEESTPHMRVIEGDK